MNKKITGFTLIELLLVTLIIAILILISTPNLLRARMMANDSNAMTTLRTLAEASQMYRINNAGQFPSNVTSLLSASNSYLKEDYCGTNVNGYAITCTFGSTSYVFQATPVNPGVSGTTTYTITSGGAITP